MFSGRINDSADKDGQVVLVVVDVEDERFVHFELPLISQAAAHLVSILSTCYVRDFRTKFWQQKFQTQNTAFVQNFRAKTHFRTKKAHVKC